MSKEIFLSFNPHYFNPLLLGMKKYEYRKRFCSEETTAYLYLSGKIQKVIGILKLGPPINLIKIRENYINNNKILSRLDEYIKNRDINAIPIKSLTLFKNPISLNTLREKIPGFMPPQMYYLLKNNKDLANYLKSIEISITLFNHNHDRIYDNNLALSCKEMEQTNEFKDLLSKLQDNEIYRNLLIK